MKTIYNDHHRRWKNIRSMSFPVAVLLLTLLFSCTSYDEYIPDGMNADLILSTSSSSYVLTQKGALSTTGISFNWTTGSNNGTGSSITYELQIDKKGNNFAAPLIYTLNKAIYTKAFTVASLNETLLNHWGYTPGVAADIEARVIAHINTDPETTDISNIVSLSVTPYKPVSTTLYIFGDATEGKWDISKATALTADENEPTTFAFKGWLNVGSFKFPVNTNTDMLQDMYMKNASDTTRMYLHKGGDSDDSQWKIGTAGLYKIAVNLCDLTIKITALQGAEFTQMFMVGDATPNGWDISNATAMVQDENNPFIFRYDGVLLVGDLKFPVNRNSDWSQDMFMKGSDSTKVYRHTGGASDDSKWHIYKSGWYTMVLDLENMTLSYERLDHLYIVGSAAPCGWNIGEAIELTQGTSGYEFTYSGGLVAGDFKFPFNRNTSWSQDMFMKDPVDEAKIYFHEGGAGDDNKWTIPSGQDGNYLVTLNLKDLTISLVKQ
ncbi:MAG TPA: SusF/SusE family outer membrane protein [Bacteroidales bacterium]|nr:SusF/SusE family outer membrane protein [Bacteroidales bacterium]